jgi:hypothetical protein
LANFSFLYLLVSYQNKIYNVSHATSETKNNFKKVVASDSCVFIAENACFTRLAVFLEIMYLFLETSSKSAFTSLNRASDMNRGANTQVTSEEIPADAKSRSLTTIFLS